MRMLLLCITGIALIACQPRGSGPDRPVVKEESLEENKRIARNYIEAMNKREWESFSALFSDQYVWHGPGGEEYHRTPDFDQTAAAKADVAADPDFRWEMEDLTPKGIKSRFGSWTWVPTLAHRSLALPRRESPSH